MTTQEKVTISLPKDLVNTLREIIPKQIRYTLSIYIFQRTRQTYTKIPK